MMQLFKPKLEELKIEEEGGGGTPSEAFLKTSDLQLTGAIKAT